MFPALAPAPFTNGLYNVYGIPALFADGTLGLIYRQASGDGGAGVAAIIRSSDGGASWGAASTLFSEGGVDIRNYAGGVNPATGRFHLWFGRYNVAGAAWLTIEHYYSDDKAATFTHQGSINVGSFPVFSPYGQLAVLDDGSHTIAMSWYGINGTTYSVFGLYSTDDTTFGSQDTILTATGGEQPTETSLACVGDGSGSLIAMARINNGTTFRQAKRVAGVWTSQGLTSFDSWVTPSPGIVTAYNYGGTPQLACYWYNRDAGAFRVTYVTAHDALAGASSWASGASPYRTIAANRSGSTLQSGGYPMIVQDTATPMFVGAFGQELSASVCQLVFAVLGDQYVLIGSGSGGGHLVPAHSSLHS